MFNKNDEEKIRIYSTKQEFESNLPNTVEILKTALNDKVYLIGTAHFSRKSHTDVSFIIRNAKPDGLVLELCPLRLHILQFDEETLLKETQNLNSSKIRQIFKEHGVTNGMFFLSFLRTNANITKQLGIAPGGECRRAIKEAKQFPNCKIFLGDRLLNITIKRALSDLNFKQKLLFSFALHADQTQNWEITEENVEKYKYCNSKPLEQMKIYTPSVYTSFVVERDYILAHSLSIAIDKCRLANNRSVSLVGVIGMGHMKGVINNFGKTNEKIVEKYMSIPKNNPNNNGNNAFFNNNVLRYLIRYSSNHLRSLKYILYFRKYGSKFKR